MAVSLFDVLEPMLSTEGHDQQAVGFALRFSRFPVDPTKVGHIRSRLLDLAFAAAKSSYARQAVRAVNFVDSAIRYPLVLFGRQVPDDQRDAWTPEFLDTLRRVSALAALPSLNPVVPVAIRSVKQSTHPPRRNVLRGTSLTASR
jgi:hypothetical protein